MDWLPWVWDVLILALSLIEAVMTIWDIQNQIAGSDAATMAVGMTCVMSITSMWTHPRLWPTFDAMDRLRLTHLARLTVNSVWAQRTTLAAVTTTVILIILMRERLSAALDALGRRFGL